MRIALVPALELRGSEGGQQPVQCSHIGESGQRYDEDDNSHGLLPVGETQVRHVEVFAELRLRLLVVPIVDD